MKCNKVLFYLFLSLALCSFQTKAQKAPIKYGKVDMADMVMTHYDKDSSAAAVVLCEYGRFDANNLEFTRIMRIKILTKDGYHWADQVFRTSSRSNIRGITYNLENGEIVESKLKQESVFKERVTKDIYNMRVAMPDVKEGSIIDIQFTHPLIPDEWSFQYTIPVRHSELIIENHPNIRFRKNCIGHEPLAEASQTRMVAKDMPAFKVEPYLNSLNNCITRCEFDILDISVPGYYFAATTSWEAVEDMLIEDENFGEAITGSLYLNSVAKEIQGNYTNKEDQMKAAYEAAKKVKWNEKERLYTSNNALGLVYKDETGNSADVNLILLQLLKKLDVEAYPLAISTRDNGILNTIYPSINKLNYVMVYVRNDNKDYLLDATEKLMPFGMLPERCINLQGRVIDRAKPKWVDLKTDKKIKSTIMYNLAMEDENTLSGQIEEAHYEYDAFDYREDYKSYNSKEEYLEDLTEDLTGLTIQEFTVEGIDSIEKPVITHMNVKMSNQTDIINDLIYLNPMFLEKTEENPFKLEDRKFPVDFPYLMDQTLIVKITLPEGYSVHQTPKPLMLKLPNNAAIYQYNINKQGNIMQLTCKFKINKNFFGVEEYPQLREFFNQIIKIESEPVVIKKN